MKRNLKSIVYHVCSRFYFVVLIASFFTVFLIMRDTGLISHRVFPPLTKDPYGLFFLVFNILSGVTIGMIEEKRNSTIILGIFSGGLFMLPYILWFQKVLRTNSDLIVKSGGIETGYTLLAASIGISFLIAVSTFNLKNKVLKPLKESVKEKSIENESKGQLD